jgi:hypothetical protein
MEKADMVKVKKNLGSDGFYVEVLVSDHVSDSFGPYTTEEADACIEGMRAFANRFIVSFEGDLDDE